MARLGYGRPVPSSPSLSLSLSLSCVCGAELYLTAGEWCSWRAESMHSHCIWVNSGATWCRLDGFVGISCFFGLYLLSWNGSSTFILLWGFTWLARPIRDSKTWRPENTDSFRETSSWDIRSIDTYLSNRYSVCIISDSFDSCISFNILVAVSTWADLTNKVASRSSSRVRHVRAYWPLLIFVSKGTAKHVK